MTDACSLFGLFILWLVHPKNYTSRRTERFIHSFKIDSLLPPGRAISGNGFDCAMACRLNWLTRS